MFLIIFNKALRRVWRSFFFYVSLLVFGVLIIVYFTENQGADPHIKNFSKFFQKNLQIKKLVVPLHSS